MKKLERVNKWHFNSGLRDKFTTNLVQLLDAFHDDEINIDDAVPEIAAGCTPDPDMFPVWIEYVWCRRSGRFIAILMASHWLEVLLIEF